MNLSVTRCASVQYLTMGVQKVKESSGAVIENFFFLFGEVGTKIIFYESTQERQDTGR